MISKVGILLFFAFFLHFGLKAQNAPKLLREGNKLYAQEKFDEAFEKYKQSLEIDPVNQKAIYNQGNSLYKQDKWQEAGQNFELSSQMMEDSKQKASSFHNLGNAYFKQEQYQKSVEAYINALKLNPDDVDTKYNLILAKKKLEQQQGEGDNNQDNQDQNQDKDENQKNNEDKGEGKEDNKSGENKDEQGNEEQEKPSPQPSKLSKEEVESILNSLKNEEGKVQQKLIYKEDKSEKVKIEKDW